MTILARGVTIRDGDHNDLAGMIGLGLVPITAVYLMRQSFVIDIGTAVFVQLDRAILYEQLGHRVLGGIDDLVLVAADVLVFPRHGFTFQDLLPFRQSGGVARWNWLVRHVDHL